MKCANHPEVNAVTTCVIGGTGLCEQCKLEVKGKNFCKNCLKEVRGSTPESIQVVPAKKNIFLTFILGLCPGVGHMYLDQIQKGLTLLGLFLFCHYISAHAGAIFSFVIAPLLVAYSVFDSVRTARQINAGEKVEDWNWQRLISGKPATTPPRGRIFGWGLIIVGILILLNNLRSLFSFFGYHWATRYMGALIPVLWSLVPIGIGIWILSRYTPKAEIDKKVEIDEPK